MATRTSSRQVVYSNHEFEDLGLWPVAAHPSFTRRKRSMLLTPFGLFVVCAAGAIMMGAALAFST